MRRRLTQAELGDRVAVSQAEISALEAGRGAHTAIETWVALGMALDRPIAIGFTRDAAQPLNDAGHLEAQELVARITGAGGWTVAFEAPSGPADPGLSSDLRLTRSGTTVLVELWNRIDDLGAAVRSSDRKIAAAPRGARSVWLLVDTAANRSIVRRYPTLLRARFPGSSSGWVRALAADGRVPTAPGLAWVDVRSGRLVELRLAAG